MWALYSLSLFCCYWYFSYFYCYWMLFHSSGIVLYCIVLVSRNVSSIHFDHLLKKFCFVWQQHTTTQYSKYVDFCKSMNATILSSNCGGFWPSWRQSFRILFCKLLFQNVDHSTAVFYYGTGLQTKILFCICISNFSFQRTGVKL